MWHASASLRRAHGAKPLAEWAPADWQRAETALRRVLVGVGVDPDIVERGRLALHIRRRVTPAEHALVGPAIDVRTK